MSLKTVFLLQNSKDATDNLKEKLEEAGFSVVGATEDGAKASSKITEAEPDLLITGLVISGCDGLSVIENVKKLGLKTKIIVLSALSSESAITKALNAGADYFMAKPFNMDLLIQRINQLSGEDFKSDYVKTPTEDFSRKPATSIDEKISRIFINVGIPPHIKGYAFLREGVKMAIEEPDIINNITKKLYPMIGEKYSTTASKVERAIRHAIEVAWNRGRIDNINNILGVRAYMGAEKPTNSEFIALVADKMILEKV